MTKRQRIILIDDSANDLEVTRRFLERSGYDVSPARSGEDGLALAQKIVPDAFVVDYRMPGMDGFEVARRVKMHPELKTVPVLMLTGAGSSENIVQGLTVGADDYVTKGSEMQILLARLGALLRVKSYQDELRRMNHHMMRDLQIARRVQEALVPPGSFMTANVEIRSAYIPSEALSGDFYDYFPQNGTLYLFVADVSGHGLPAAILVSLLKSYIHTEADADTSLAEFMSKLNNFLFSVSLPTQFATAQLFRIGADRNLVYANAAHPPFLLLMKEKDETMVFEQPSNLLGAMPNMAFEEHTLPLAAGDTLFAYTDGLTDRRNENGDFYSIDRVAALLEQTRGDDLGKVYDAIFADVSNFSATDELRDDIAFVVSRFH